LLGSLFIAALFAAFFVDVDAVLKYLSVIRGSAGTAMEIGGFVTAAAALPLLAMGMSIDDEELHRD